MAAEAERDAAIARAERAEASLVECASNGLKLREELADVYRRAERAEAALMKLQEESNALCNHILDDSIFGCERNQPCVWQRFVAGDSSWYVSTSCRETLYWNSDDGPDEEHKFCPYCGHPLRLVTSDNDLLSGDNQPG